MKTTTRIILTIATVMAFALALTGCSQPDYTKNFSGDWKLASVTSDGETASEEDMAMLEAFGMSVGLTLNEDGTLQFTMLGETSDGTWKAKSATEAEVTLEGSTVTAKLADDKLSMEADGEAMVFVRGKADTSSMDLSSLATEDESSDETEIPMNETIIDDELITVTITSKFQDWTGACGYAFTAVNNSDKDFNLTYVSNSFSVDNKMGDPFLFTALNVGTSADDQMEFSTDKVASVDELTNVKGTLLIYDKNTYEDIREYPIELS